MAAITVLNKSNVPTGPFTREQVAEKLKSGEFSLDDLAFVEGLTAWTPLRDVLAKVDGAPPVPNSPAVTPSTFAPQAAAYSYAATMQPPSHLVYAGFWLRFVAIMLDGIIVGIPLFMVGVAAGAIYGFTLGQVHSVKFVEENGELNVSFVIMEIGLVLFSILVRWLYFALQESSAAQATIGKRVLGIRVIDMKGGRIGFGRATGRFFGKYISAMTLLIGFIMAGFTERKQALHDMIASTLVIRN